MAAGGGPAQRISFGEGSYSTPVWSPRGDTIAFTKQSDGKFAIGIMRPDGQGERILTEGYHNEGPTFAPNGRVLMFFRDPGGNAGPHALFDRHHWPKRTEGADTELRVRSGMVAASGAGVSRACREADTGNSRGAQKRGMRTRRRRAVHRRTTR